ncbi:nucleotide-binding universal stress UspA family protein [Neorhizobium galegae]|uniref:universal stress protein n=1 Tax=Neorhizobium galegae TaxID=399 RepID=UPI001AE97B94|nr:universal stress protein [Neorhizobium galegae]MBP2547112.1 nucleotide-binding universal stress UspA family protein [Neorhizobium galegae]
MGYKTILAVLDSPKNTGPISEFAIDLARQFSAHVVGLRAEILPTVPVIAPMEIPDPTAMEMLQQAAEVETGKIAAAFREKAEHEGISFEWRSFVSSAGYSSESVLECARASDLILAAQTDPALSNDNSADLETLLFESGRPVLLVPYILSAPKPVRRVLIGWNGSKEAARAAFDALPFLTRAESVEILSIDPPGMPRQAPDLAGADLAAALARHGVNVTLTTLEKGELSVEAVIENRLSDNSIDLLVMGGYGHSRWWEMLFGGVTRNVLNSMTALTLLSR